MSDDDKSNTAALEGMAETAKRFDEDHGPLVTVVLLLLFLFFFDGAVNDSQFTIRFLNWIGTVF